MGTLPNTRMTLLDLAKRADPDGTVAPIVELLEQQNEVLRDMSFFHGNLETGHRTTVRTGLPDVTWRALNEGVQPSKSTTAQVTFNTGILESFSEIDVELAKLHGNDRAARFSEDLAFMEAMQQEMSRTLFYGNEKVSPKEFTGLSMYYNDDNAESRDNIIEGKGAGSGTNYGSIWLVGWSANTISGIIPKHGQAGMSIRDLGERVSEDAGGSGKRLRVFSTHLQQKAGLAVRDWRYGVRIANIRRSDLVPDPAATNSIDLAQLMFEALDRLPSTANVTPVFYMDRFIKTRLRQQLAFGTKQSTLVTENVGGVITDLFQGIPVRRVDALSVTESLVTLT
jgi:hypothetical protein